HTHILGQPRLGRRREREDYQRASKGATDEIAVVRASLATGNGIRRARVLSNRATDRAEDAPGSKLAVLAQAKVRGRNRITGNRSARSRPLAPSQPPPRIAIASDVPPRGRKFDHVVTGQHRRQSGESRAGADRRSTRGLSSSDGGE